MLENLYSKCELSTFFVQVQSLILFVVAIFLQGLFFLNFQELKGYKSRPEASFFSNQGNSVGFVPVFIVILLFSYQ
jgi:hypothetical protein